MVLGAMRGEEGRAGREIEGGEKSWGSAGCDFAG